MNKIIVRLVHKCRNQSELIKRKTPFLVLAFMVVTLSSSIISSYKHNAGNISLTIESQDSMDLPLIKVYKVSRSGNVSELEKSGAAWNYKGKKYVGKIWISLPKHKIKNIKEIRVSVGTGIFKFNNQDVAKFKIIDEPTPMIDVTKNLILELPDFVRSQTSLFYKILLFFSPISKSIINWGGDPLFLNSVIKKFIAYFLVPLLFFVLLSFDFPKKFSLPLIFFLTVLVVGFFSITQIAPHHDGVMLKPAMDVVNGKMLFRDTFTQYGALTTLIQASALKLFGEYLIVIRLLTALFYGLISVLLWNIYSRILPNRLNIFSCIMWLAFGYFFINQPTSVIFPWSTVFSIFSILLSLYLLILFLEKQKLVLLFLAGIVSSLTFWLKINYGIISFLSIFSFLVTLQLFTDKKNTFKVLLIFLSGYAIPHLLFIGWLAINGALRDFILQSVKFAFAFSNSISSTNEFILTRITKCLFPIGNKNLGISAVWTILPIIATGIFAHSIYKIATRKNILLSDKIVLAISFVAFGLWFGYYPISAPFQVYLSSTAFWGLLSYFLWKTAGKLGITNKKFFVMILILFVSIHDLSFRITNVFEKISKIKQYERIEVPKFLSGMYVPKNEKLVHAEIWESVNKFPYYLINLTNSGLYSLYKNNNKEFHKMYMDWGWVNSYLYPNYITELNKQLLSKSSIILSDNTFMITGYIPIKVFPKLGGDWNFAEEIVLLVPGNSRNVFKPVNYLPRNKNFFRIGLKAESNQPITINSVIAKVFTENDIPSVIIDNEFNYNVMPRILDEEDRQFVKELYSFDKDTKQYSIRPQKDKKIIFRAIRIFSNLFLSEKYSFLADTFKNSTNTKIDVYLNKELVNYQTNDSLGINCSKNDLLELVVPIPELPKQYIVKVRINYNGNYYQEKVVEKK